MKRFSKFVLVVASLISMTVPAWGQASTEGKEFWVALNMTTGTGGTDHKPFICITTQYQGGSYTISNPADASFTPITGSIPANGYVKIKASESPASGEIDLNKWYPVGKTAQAVSNQVKDVGLKITTTVDCSVFAGNLLPQSFDAANILPITALQTEYITQDYPGYDHENKGGGYPVTTILATENSTQVTINPSSAVLNNTGTATIVKTLNAGQVLYLTGDNRASLSGTSITSDKKIAVFTGVNNTDVPGPVSARDHLYEQNMPIDYWGTHFVVTRSMKKDANRIRVTAKENKTKLSVDGDSITTINSGETYEFELCSDIMRTQDGYTKADAEGRGTKYFYEGEAHYLETSCPCAVFSYDVSENYYIKKNGTSERDDNAAGDPAMVWISPLEQQLNKVTFGVMNTDNTPTHYVNIITPTSGAGSLEVREITLNNGKAEYGDNLVLPTDVKPVPGKTSYSYARIKLTENAPSVYTITSDIGFIAHVYGSGTKESYAYSCGSAAVKQGVKVNNETFINGYRSDSKFCMGNEFTFDAKVGTDEITRVDWDFGDGTTQYNGEPVTTHKYNNPGWYDATAKLYGRQACANVSEQDLGSISFTFRVWQAEKKTGSVEPRYIEADSTINGIKLTPDQVRDSLLNGTIRIDIPDYCYEDTIVHYLSYCLKTKDKRYGQDTIGFDQIVLNDSTYTLATLPPGGIVEWTETNNNNCDSLFRFHAIIRTCLDIKIPNVPDNQHICLGEKSMSVGYNKIKGDIDGDTAVFTIAGMPSFRKTIKFQRADSIEIPLDGLTRPGYYTGKIAINDANCMNDESHPEKPEFEVPIDFSVNYPEDIFDFKFTNVLAVRKDAGYNFRNYQWYINGKPVGGDVSVLYLGEGVALKNNDLVYVKLTDQSGMVLESCPKTIQYKVGQLQPNKAPARKVMQNQRIYILRDEQVYDIFGQKVK